MIRYEHRGNGSYPLIFCDACGKPIMNMQATANWNDAGGLCFAHQCENCSQICESTHPYWTPLEAFLRDLVHNTKLPKTPSPGITALQELFGASEDRNKL